MKKALTEHLTALADRYERAEFINGDPSWFMHQVNGETNQEILAFIASALSYGSRKQFLPKIESLMIRNIDGSINPDGDYKEWLLSGKYKEVVPRTDECFYRLYTKAMMHDFLAALAEIVRKFGSLRGFIEYKKREKSVTITTSFCGKESENARKLTALEAVNVITQSFAELGSTGVIPKDSKSSCKRVCMFLRWMVRDNSPVDLGLWTDLIDKKSLIIPMDTHVVQEAQKLGLLTSKSTSMSTALKLSQKLATIWPSDPCKGDFALFGLGVDED